MSNDKIPGKMGRREFQAEAEKVDVKGDLLEQMGKSYLDWVRAVMIARGICPNLEVVFGVETVQQPDQKCHLFVVGETGNVSLKSTSGFTDEAGLRPGVYYHANGTATVVSGVRFPNGDVVLEGLPVMTPGMKSDTSPHAMSINKTAKRAFVKALALCGLGLSVFTGETFHDDVGPSNKQTANLSPAAAAVQVKLKGADVETAKILSTATTKADFRAAYVKLDNKLKTSPIVSWAQSHANKMEE